MAALLSLAAIVERDRGVASACYSLHMSIPPDPQPGGSVGRGLTTDHHTTEEQQQVHVLPPAAAADAYASVLLTEQGGNADSPMDGPYLSPYTAQSTSETAAAILPIRRDAGNSQRQNPSTRTDTHWALHTEASRLRTVWVFDTQPRGGRRPPSSNI